MTEPITLEMLAKLSDEQHLAWSGPTGGPSPAGDFLRETESRIATLEDERDRWKELALGAGVCPSCALGWPEPYGCTDCMNTGFDGSWHIKRAAERDAAEERGAERAAAAFERAKERYQGTLSHLSSL